jgi:peptide deformylase
MAIKNVLKMGNPRLRQRAEPVKQEELTCPTINALITDLQDTMAHYQGAGIAAPQIGIAKQVIIFGFAHNPRYSQAEPAPETILLNPKFEILSTEMETLWEGCLSIPGLRGAVARSNKIHYWGLDQNGQVIDRVATGFHARVVQHECDHLNGILFPERMTNMRQFDFESELEQVQSVAKPKDKQI